MMDSPLTDQHCDCFNQVLNRTPQLIQLANDCIECGWDFAQQYKERLLEQQRQAQLAKAKWFPNRP